MRVEETSLQIFKWMPISKNDESQSQKQHIAALAAEQQQQLTRSINYNSREPSLFNQKDSRDPNTFGVEQSERPISVRSEAASMPKEMNGSNDAGISNASTVNIGEQARLNTNDGSIIMISSGMTTSTATSLQPVNMEGSHKRPHEDDECDFPDSPVTDSPHSKRAKTANPMITPGLDETGTPSLAPMQSVEVVPVKTGSVPVTAEQFQVGHASQQQHSASISHHVQSTNTDMTSNRAASSITTNDGLRLTMNGDGDFDMMDSEDTVGDSSISMSISNSLPTTTLLLSGDLEDFSSIARNVTEQIVLKVSDCYGGDS